MYQCSFVLNNKPMSALKIGSMSFPAFSGAPSHRNRRASACIPDVGPTPPGRYWIFDRESGGRLGPLWDILRNRSKWFALHAVDERIDDVTYCDHLERNAFRLHPKGSAGMSLGCIVIDGASSYSHLRAILTSVTPQAVAGSRLRAYGQVAVV